MIEDESKEIDEKDTGSDLDIGKEKGHLFFLRLKQRSRELRIMYRIGEQRGLIYVYVCI